MPIYEYQCSKCGTLEVFQRITDDPLARCPTCRSKVTKLISRSSFHLKGTGWYATDYAGKSANGSRYDGAGATETNGTGKSDSISASTEAAQKSESSSSKEAASKTKPGDKNGSVGSKAA